MYRYENVRASVFEWSCHTDFRQNLIIYHFLARKHGHVVAAMLSRDQLRKRYSRQRYRITNLPYILPTPFGQLSASLQVGEYAVIVSEIFQQFSRENCLSVKLFLIFLSKFIA